MVVVHALVAAGMGVTILPGYALEAHRRSDIYATELTAFRRQIHAATYGDHPIPRRRHGGARRSNHTDDCDRRRSVTTWGKPS